MKLKNLKIIVIFVLIFLIFLILNKFFYQRIKNAVFLISSPIQKFLWQKQGIFSQAFESLFEAKRMERENEELKKENLFLKNQLLELKDLEEENKELREALELGLKTEYRLIFAEVISKKVEEDSILVNRGEKDGVSEGMTAITKERVLLGKVEEVFDDFSKIRLITDKGFTFSVIVEPDIGITRGGLSDNLIEELSQGLAEDSSVSSAEDSVLAACEGKGNFGLKIKFLPQDCQIKEGYIVSTSFLGGIFPENLLVGRVKEIEKKDIEVFQEGEISPFFKDLEIETLFLVTPREE